MNPILWRPKPKRFWLLLWKYSPWASIGTAARWEALDSRFGNTELSNALWGADAKQRILCGTELFPCQLLKPDVFILCLEVEGWTAGSPSADSIRTDCSWFHPDRPGKFVHNHSHQLGQQEPPQRMPWPSGSSFPSVALPESQANSHCSYAGCHGLLDIVGCYEQQTHLSEGCNCESVAKTR